MGNRFCHRNDAGHEVNHGRHLFGQCQVMMRFIDIHFAVLPLHMGTSAFADFVADDLSLVIQLHLALADRTEEAGLEGVVHWGGV